MTDTHEGRVLDLVGIEPREERISRSIADRYRPQLDPGDVFQMLNAGDVMGMLEKSPIPVGTKLSLCTQELQLRQTETSIKAWRTFRKEVITTFYQALKEPMAVRFLRLVNTKGEPLPDSPLAYPVALTKAV